MGPESRQDFQDAGTVGALRMKIAILCQEEPVLMGPFLQGVIKMQPGRIVAVFIAGSRGAGEKIKTPRQRLNSLRIFWLILEPRYFFAGLLLRLRAGFLGRRDPRSVERLARKLKIPVYHVKDPNDPEFLTLLRSTAPHVVLNQSELILKKEVLSIPRLGFINRHASLLPNFRGRLASFWAHADENPRYGVTIHMVDDGIDTGDIIVQQEFDNIPSTWPYPKVARRLFAEAPALLWKAVDLLGRDEFRPRPQTPVDKPRRFPTMEEARHYRTLLRRRRSSTP